MINRVIRAFEYISLKVDKLFDLLDYIAGIIFKPIKKAVVIFGLVGNMVLTNFNKPIEKYQRNLRYLGLPWTSVIPKVYTHFKKDPLSKPIFLPGTHQIRAKVGGGKSLTALIIAEEILKLFKVASYISSSIEKPQLSEDGKYWYVHHRVADPKSYYKDGKKIKRHNTAKYPYFHKDERHLDYNPRLNKSKEYNATFIPEHEDELLMRHAGFKAIYKYSQHIKMDSQEMEALTFLHELQLKKDLPLKKWLDDGKFDKIPTKITFYTYTIDYDFDGSMKRKLFKKWSLKVPLEVLAKFDTHAEKNRHSGLPLDYN